mgnify:CR=1 FL=1
MPAVIDKALDFIGGMNTSEPVPQSMDESTAKGILKYLKELGVTTLYLCPIFESASNHRYNTADYTCQQN